MEDWCTYYGPVAFDQFLDEKGHIIVFDDTFRIHPTLFQLSYPARFASGAWFYVEIMHPDDLDLAPSLLGPHEGFFYHNLAIPQFPTTANPKHFHGDLLI